jgi:tetratricopeptide (TPR) repeat protein
MRTEIRPILLTVFLSLSLAGHVDAQVPGVGQVSFPNSGAAAAQQDFLTGLAQLHNFEYGNAAEFFRKAQQADPGFAMAYWGEAMTHNHAVWMVQDAAAARAILQRLGPTPQVRLEKAKSEREKDYLRAVEVLYGDGEKKARDFAYADAIADVHRKYPDDIEAAAFTALALLGTAHDGRDFAVYMRSAAILEPLFPSHPKHPGIAHYLIHSYDDPVHAPLGLRAAREYSKIAPSAAHAQHMCSHIFVAMGLWDDVVEANEAAVKITRGPVAGARSAGVCGHYPSWLTYGYLQQGRVEAARTMVTACHKAVSGAPAPRTAWGVVAGMRSRYLLDTDEWSGEVAAITIPLSAQPAAAFTYEFTNAFSAIRRGDLPLARAALARMEAARKAIEEPVSKPDDPGHASMPGMAAPEMLDPGSRGRRKILQDEITAMIRHKEGAEREAIDLLRAAATLEETLPFEFGPPFVDKPTYELLGEVLLASNQPKEARAAFEKALGRTPDRTAALVGLMKAAAQMGDRKKEGEIAVRLQAIWHRADRKPTDLQR